MLMHLARWECLKPGDFCEMVINGSKLKRAIADSSRPTAFHPTQTLLVSGQVDSVVCMGQEYCTKICLHSSRTSGVINILKLRRRELK